MFAEHLGLSGSSQSASTLNDPRDAATRRCSVRTIAVGQVWPTFRNNRAIPRTSWWANCKCRSFKGICVGSSENVAERVGYHAMPAGIGRVWWAKGDQYWEAFDMERRRPVCSPRGTRTGINGCYWHDLDSDLNLDNALERDIQKPPVVVVVLSATTGISAPENSSPHLTPCSRVFAVMSAELCVADFIGRPLYMLQGH
ncbi:Ribosome-releasing factor 2, mitochondrial [Temnothorax longispinosus]|uniref:Ribosome-releasing factor 2, mitochondrial n=1 Tax=Temnothorax longispinosus TaxID=300112 RepID=A0A4S2KJ43_9HYME|nr:Ribosome-releasing factor 2, mitochondrial [Temnothorax longispinosus]